MELYRIDFEGGKLEENDTYSGERGYIEVFSENIEQLQSFAKEYFLHKLDEYDTYTVSVTVPPIDLSNVKSNTKLEWQEVHRWKTQFLLRKNK